MRQTKHTDHVGPANKTCLFCWRLDTLVLQHSGILVIVKVTSQIDSVLR